TDVTFARQTMLLEMRIKAELFYDLYKELNSRGKFGKLMPASAYVLDADDVPALRHHGNWAPRGRLARVRDHVTYAHTILTLVRSHLLKDCSAEDGPPLICRVFKFNSDGSQGLYKGLLNHARYLCEHYDHPSKLERERWWTRLDVELVLGDMLDHFLVAKRAGEVERALQSIALLQLAFCTGQRIGAFTVQRSSSG
ncbi:hypothetical protein OC834_007930, partial [Tilletia horrida]